MLEVMTDTELLANKIKVLQVLTDKELLINKIKVL